MHKKLLEIKSIDPGGIASKCLLDNGNKGPELDNGAVVSQDSVSEAETLPRTGSTDVLVEKDVDTGRCAQCLGGDERLALQGLLQVDQRETVNAELLESPPRKR